MFLLSLEKLNELEKEYLTYRHAGLRTGYWPYRTPKMWFIEQILITAGRLQALDQEAKAA